MNSISLLIVALFVACVSCLSEQEYQTSFTNWMKEQGKSYSAEEFQPRYAIFKRNTDYINEWNAQGSETVLGLTLFADLTNEEYQRIYLGTRISKTPTIVAEARVGALPTSVDWNAKGAVTAIKNQGQCGDCWAFSATGSTEGIHQISTGSLVSLSEQNLMDCSGSFGNEGCDGGLMDYAFEYIIKNKGVDTEASYPYEEKQGKCRFTAANVGATITGYTDVTSGSEAALQTAVVQQPVSVAIDASHNSFQLYLSGIYYEPKCSATELDHGVLAIGYGTNSSGSDYWYVKNSWGTSWGQAGFIWMSRNRNNNCGIATAASFPLVSGTSTAAATASSGQTTTTGSSSSSSSSSSDSSSSSSASASSSSSSSASASSSSSSSASASSSSSSSSASDSSSSSSSASNSASSSSSSSSASDSSSSSSSASNSASSSSSSASNSASASASSSSASSDSSSSSSSSSSTGTTSVNAAEVFNAAKGARAVAELADF